jgi:hypothetical protein
LGWLRLSGIEFAGIESPGEDGTIDVGIAKLNPSVFSLFPDLPFRRPRLPVT